MNGDTRLYFYDSGHGRQVDDVGGRGPVLVVEAGQPEQVLDQVPEAGALVGDADDGLPVGIRRAFPKQRQRRLGLDHLQRRAQLVGGVGGKGEQPPAGGFDGLGADAAGYNCSPWPTDSAGAGVLKPDAAGLAPEDWARRVVGFASSARFLGGCCGTTAAHLGALQRLRATPR